MFHLKKFATLLVVALAAVLLSPSDARADAFSLTNGQSVTVNYLTSFAGSHATATFTYNQATSQLTVVLTNNSTDNTKLFSFGFDAAGLAQSGLAGISYGGGTTANFVNGAQSLQLDFGTNSTQGNDNAVLNAGEQLTAVFTFTTAPATLNIDLTKIHMGALPNGSSEKPNGTVPVPEPATMFLLGAGILGAAAKIRRRHEVSTTSR